MKVKVGDKVKFLNDTGSGEIIKIVDQKTALVRIEEGFEVPWLISDLVVDKANYSGHYEGLPDEHADKNFTEDEQSLGHTAELTPDQPFIEDEEVLLAFLPDENSSYFSTYLINSSSYLMKYTISRHKEGEMVLFHESTLEAGIKINLGIYRPENLNDEELFRIQGLFYNTGFYANLAPLDIQIKISVSEMYKAENRKENDYFNDKAVLYTLYEWKKTSKGNDIEIDRERLRDALLTKGDIKENKKVEYTPKMEEVDLHIEHLMDNYKSLTNSEIIDIQLSRFRTAIEGAILHKRRKMVFIHGVGNGKLKHEIRRLLDTEYRSLARYQDASFKEYGYGATMVLLK